MPADFIPARVCILICEIILTLPVELVDTESLVPQEHLLRKVDRAVEFRKLYEIVEPLYSEEEGRTSKIGRASCRERV